MVIVLVAVVAVIVGLVYYRGSQPAGPGPRNPIETPGNSNKPTPAPTNVPLGATPPNYLGAQNSAVTVEEFADFQCPSCGATHPVMKQIQGIFGQRIKFIFRNFPLPIHDKAYDAATAAEAAGIQGSEKFWAMQNMLYTNQQQWSSDPNYKQVFRGYAEKIGLDVDKWENDMAGMGARGRIQADMDRGKALQINSTPTVFINGKSVPYPDMKVDTMRQLIEDEIKATQSSSSSAPVSTPNVSTSATNNSNK